MNRRILFFSLVFLFVISLILSVGMGQEFSGADVKVNSMVNDFALKVGAGERTPYFNTDQGDLLLFLFLASGLVAGFYLGYQWRKIFGEGEGKI